LAGRIARGVLLPPVHFRRDVRRDLAKCLTGLDAEQIITEFEQAVELVPAFAADDQAPEGFGLDQLQQFIEGRLAKPPRGVRAKSRNRAPAHLIPGLLQVLRNLDEDTETRIHDALRRRGWGEDYLRNLEDALRELATVCSIGEQDPRPGGRPRDEAANHLVRAVTTALTKRGASVSTSEDGVAAKVLRILWPMAFGKDAPVELKPRLKAALAQRK
jgi:hypothetical protein